MMVSQIQIGNAEAEQDVLALVLYDNSHYAELSHLKPHHFLEPTHARTWSAMSAQIEAGKTANPACIRSAMRGDSGLAELSQAFGGDYLIALADRAPNPAWAKDCANAIIEDWTRRQAAEIGTNLASMAALAAPALDLLNYARDELAKLESNAAISDAEFSAATDVAEAVVGQIAENLRSGRRLGHMCGLRCIDYRLGGLHPGKLIVVGGRPGMAKTGLARAVAHGCAKRNPNNQVIFLGLEMGPDEIMQRELAAISHDLGQGVEYRDMARGSVSPAEMAAIQRAKAHVPQNLIFKDCHSLGLNDVRRIVWSRKRKGPVALVVIDYLQLMRRPDAKGRNETTVLGEITSGLKLLARQSGCAILLLSQLSRQVESREDKRPMLSDLRDSGSIEQDADAVLFPFREAYYLERAKPAKGKETEHDMRVADMAQVMEVIAAKVRQGSVGVDKQRYRAEYDHISDWEAA
jgi:replicative DNA helicase